MLDLKIIRQSYDKLDAALQKRGQAPLGQKIVTLDKKVRALSSEVEALRCERKKLAQHYRAQDSQAVTQTQKEGSALREDIAQKEKELTHDKNALQQLLATLPNIPAPEVPVGEDESDNVCMRTWGTPPAFDFTPKAHDELGPPLGLDMVSGAQLAGSRFVCLQGTMARLERALASFMLDIHTQQFGYTEIVPPLLVKPDMLYSAGMLPKFQEEAFQTTDGRWLIPTAEVVLINLMRQKTWSAEELPKKFVAYTPCFRSEAGAAGRDTRGMIRLHQFSKVELVGITTAEDAENMHTQMLSHAETILQKLELPYRVVLLCGGDLGFAAQKTYDIEVWLPGQQTYREIASCSNCGDFQARRMGAFFKNKKGEKSLLHTLNSSGLPVLGRTMAALLENGQQADGSVVWPKVLLPYLKNT